MTLQKRSNHNTIQSLTYDSEDKGKRGKPSNTGLGIGVRHKKNA